MRLPSGYVLTVVETGKFWKNVVELVESNIGLMGFGPLGDALDQFIWIYIDSRQIWYQWTSPLCEKSSGC